MTSTQKKMLRYVTIEVENRLIDTWKKSQTSDGSSLGRSGSEEGYKS